MALKQRIAGVGAALVVSVALLGSAAGPAGAAGLAGSLLGTVTKTVDGAAAQVVPPAPAPTQSPDEGPAGEAPEQSPSQGSGTTGQPAARPAEASPRPGAGRDSGVAHAALLTTHAASAPAKGASSSTHSASRDAPARPRIEGVRLAPLASAPRLPGVQRLAGAVGGVLHSAADAPAREVAGTVSGAAAALGVGPLPPQEALSGPVPGVILGLAGALEATPLAPILIAPTATGAVILSPVPSALPGAALPGLAPLHPRVASSRGRPLGRDGAVPAAGPAPAGPGAYRAGGEHHAGFAISSSSASLPRLLRAPGTGHVPASTMGAVAVCAGVALALLWLFCVCAGALARRPRPGPLVCLTAPFELILERPG